MLHARIPEALYLSVSEAAELLGVHRNAIYQAIGSGRLRPIRMMGKQALLRAEVIAYSPRKYPRQGRVDG